MGDDQLSRSRVCSSGNGVSLSKSGVPLEIVLQSLGRGDAFFSEAYRRRLGAGLAGLGLLEDPGV